MTKDIKEILPVRYPIIQAGMVYASGAKLAAASANAGFLGVIGAGSMNGELLNSQIIKAKALCQNAPNLAVNLPLLYSQVKEQIDICLENGIKIFITSAGSPKTYTPYLKDRGAKVIHVTSSPLLAKKCEDAGVDAVVAEGFEAGGHNGREEFTTMVLIPQVVEAVKIPVIAAGGITNGAQVIAALSLGASAVQMGTRFLVTQESSAHANFKQAILNAQASDTLLQMKKYLPVRLLKNKFSEEIQNLESQGASAQELQDFLGKGRAKAGMLEGDIEQGELEVGQGIGLIKELLSVEELKTKLLGEINQTLKEIATRSSQWI